jgi:nitrate/nitrite transporter NarK
MRRILPLSVVLVLAGVGCGDAPSSFPDAAVPSDFAGFESPDAATSLGAACDVFKQQGCPDKMHCTVGSVTGLVGAAGGLGGFFPPLVLGIVRRETGTFTIGFALLAVFAVICLLTLLKTKANARALEVATVH